MLLCSHALSLTLTYVRVHLCVQVHMYVPMHFSYRFPYQLNIDVSITKATFLLSEKGAGAAVASTLAVSFLYQSFTQHKTMIAYTPYFANGSDGNGTQNISASLAFNVSRSTV